MRVISVDPGYERVGIAIVEKNGGDKETVLFSECFKTSAKLPHHERLSLIGEKIKVCIKKWSPETLAIETLFMQNNQKTVMHVAEARGVIIYEAARAGLSVDEYSPLEVKIGVTGYGRSNKDQVTDMVKRLVCLPKTAFYDDEYDAIAIGITSVNSQKYRLLRK